MILSGQTAPDNLLSYQGLVSGERNYRVNLSLETVGSGGDYSNKFVTLILVR